MSLEKPLSDYVSVMAFLQDRKPAIMSNLLLISEPAEDVLLPVISTPSWPVPSLVSVIPLLSLRVLSLNYSCSAPPSLMPLSETQGATNPLLFLHAHLLLGVFPTVILCILQKLPIMALIGRGPHASHLNINSRHLILIMAALKKGPELMETGIDEVLEGKERPPCSPQSLGRKLQWARNRELAGWELDCWAEVSECLTS